VPPVVTFLSDFGTADEFVGSCHGVIASRCPSALVIDITHGVPPHDIRAGALMLRAALPYMPAGVHLAVVDPGVGMGSGPEGRRAVALATASRSRLLVGPDNGLLLPAAALFGGVREAFDIGASRARIEPVSATFHGRDIFSPVAAALAAGEPLDALGDPFDPATLATLELLSTEVRGDALLTRVLHADRFGNLTTGAAAGELSALGVAPGDRVEVRCAGRSLPAIVCRTFAEVPAGAALVLEDSRGLLAVAVNRGSAAELLGADPGAELLLSTAPGAARPAAGTGTPA
jgi:S-adenosylmethionine hydrolase